MNLIVYGIVIVLLFLMEKVTHKRIRGFLPIVTLIYIIILMGGNGSNPDTTIYYNMYNSGYFFYKDIGFGIVIDFCKKTLGLNIEQFRLVMAVLGLSIMHKVVNKYVLNPMTYYFLYFLYPFMMDVVQMRNFLMMCVMMVAFDALLDRSKKGIVKFLILNLVAASLQKTALVYLPLVFIHRVDKKKFVKCLFGMAAVISLVCGFNESVVNSIAGFLLSNISDNLSGSAGFFVRNTNFGWLILWGEQVVNVLLVYWSKRMTEKYETQYRKNTCLFKVEYNRIIDFYDFLLWVNIYLFIFCPLYVLNINFYRIMRNIMVINLMGYSMSIKSSRIWKKNYRILYGIAIWSYALFMFYINFFYNGKGEYIESILITMFTNNWLSQLF